MKNIIYSAEAAFQDMVKGFYNDFLDPFENPRQLVTGHRSFILDDSQGGWWCLFDGAPCGKEKLFQWIVTEAEHRFDHDAFPRVTVRDIKGRLWDIRACHQVNKENGSIRMWMEYIIHDGEKTVQGTITCPGRDEMYRAMGELFFKNIVDMYV